MKYGYIKISTIGLNEIKQIMKLKKHNVTLDNIYIEKAFKRNFKDRIEWEKLMNIVNIGDVIILKELYSLGKNIKEIKDTYTLIRKKEVFLEFLDTPELNTYGKSKIELESMQSLISNFLEYLTKKEEYNNTTLEETIKNLDLYEEDLIKDYLNFIVHNLFCKEEVKVNQIVRYNLSKINGMERYMQISPALGKTIPNIFDEKVFIALLNIMGKNEDVEKCFDIIKFTVTISEIADEMGVLKLSYNQIEESLQRIGTTSYTFKTYLFQEFNRLDLKFIDDTLTTSIAKIVILSKKNATEEEKEEYFKNKKAEEICIIYMSQYFCRLMFLFKLMC